MGSDSDASAVRAGVVVDEEIQARLGYFAFDTRQVSEGAHRVAVGGERVAEAGWKVADLAIRMDIAGSRGVGGPILRQ